MSVDCVESCPRILHSTTHVCFKVLQVYVHAPAVTCSALQYTQKPRSNVPVTSRHTIPLRCLQPFPSLQNQKGRHAHAHARAPAAHKQPSPYLTYTLYHLYIPFNSAKLVHSERAVTSLACRTVCLRVLSAGSRAVCSDLGLFGSSSKACGYSGFLFFAFFSIGSVYYYILDLQGLEERM